MEIPGKTTPPQLTPLSMLPSIARIWAGSSPGLCLASVLLMLLTLLCCTKSKRAAETGLLHIYTFGSLSVGEEKYEIRRDGSSLVLESALTIRDPWRPLNAALTTKVRMSPGLDAQRFEMRGQTPALMEPVQISLDNNGRQLGIPSHSFPISGTLPPSLQMALVRYWLSHGRPNVLKTAPQGSVLIEETGHDEIDVGGVQHQLTRYCLDGLLYGREWLWLDSEKRLIALVSTYRSSDYFMSYQAVRKEFEAVLTEFLRKAAEDGEARLERGVPLEDATTGQDTAIVGAKLIGGAADVLVQDSAVLIHGNRIVAAGPRARVEIPGGARIIHAGGKTVLPGLWDMHFHTTNVEQLPAALAAGITTVRDCGAQVDFIVAVRRVLNSGRGLGPRLLLVGTMDAPTSPTLLGMEATVGSAAEAAEAVHRYKSLGFDEVKVFDYISPDNLRAVATEAHRLKLKVTGHVPEKMNIVQAVEAGMDQVEHSVFLFPVMLPKGMPVPQPPRGVDDPFLRKELLASAVKLPSREFDEVARFLKRHGTVIDPTLVAWERSNHSKDQLPSTFEPGLLKAPAEIVAAINTQGLQPAISAVWRVAFNQELRVIAALRAAGITIVAGSDTRIPGHDLHRELELLIEGGFTPLQAIQAATSVPARVMGFDRDLGTIQAGKIADLIVVDGDPSQNIHDIRRVALVIKDGREFSSRALWEVAGFRP
jgi:imidazolonepropionase-like amidohydrolase